MGVRSCQSSPDPRLECAWVVGQLLGYAYLVHHKTAYELSESQVTTPPQIVSLFWRLVAKYRATLGQVLDLGAGDCRFAQGVGFKSYTGLEIDPRRSKHAVLPSNARLLHTCAFRHNQGDYDAVVGNPPYVRHHDIENPWKESTSRRIKKELGITLNQHCNLYLYFFCLGLLKTHASGLVGLLIPYEWVSRPSARPLRRHIQANKWNVNVYRFRKPIFQDVLTTASVSIVDKGTRDGRWTYHDITGDLQVAPRNGITGSRNGVLEYGNRGRAWALRGLSPGTQQVFTLSEGERIHFGLSRRDVVPCVTTLRGTPKSLRILTRAAFQKHFVDSGARCWLIKSYENKISPELDAYLSSVPKERRQTFTCKHQEPWFNYLPHPTPQMLVGSGFTEFGPKVLVNRVRARAVGSVWGIHSKLKLPHRRIQKHLLSMDFEKQLVAHAKTLKKIEVKQLNSVLNAFLQDKRANGRARTAR